MTSDIIYHKHDNILFWLLLKSHNTRKWLNKILADIYRLKVAGFSSSLSALWSQSCSWNPEKESWHTGGSLKNLHRLLTDNQSAPLKPETITYIKKSSVQITKRDWLDWDVWSSQRHERARGENICPDTLKVEKILCVPYSVQGVKNSAILCTLSVFVLLLVCALYPQCTDLCDPNMIVTFRAKWHM